jgi:hypothetical protein
MSEINHLKPCFFQGVSEPDLCEAIEMKVSLITLSAELNRAGFAGG